MKSIQILLVEDNAGDARLTEEALKEGKLTNVASLAHVRDGVEALAYLRQEEGYESSLRPDLILLDLNMPRMGGREVLEQIKNDDDLKTIPVVVLTTSQAERDIAQSYLLHANCYISKPVDLDEFVVVVQNVKDFWFDIVKLPGALDD